MKCRQYRVIPYQITQALNGAKRLTPPENRLYFIPCVSHRFIMIPLVEEPKQHFEEFGLYENCYFNCGRKTKFWHWRTNQPICKECAKKHKVAEVEKCTPDYKPPTKKEYQSSL